jgi:isovaleryl-CoA dehydrogenase
MTDLFNPTAEHRALRELVRSFAEREVDPQAEASDQAERFNIELFRKLGDLGLLGVTVEERFGGSGLDPVAAVIIHEELSAADPGFALAYLAHSMLFANNLQVNGNDAQRGKYLPDACSGKKICGMCMSEPGAGTDVLGMQTSATKKGDHYVLNGAKMWISMFLVEKGYPGFSLGQKIKGKLGMRASTTAELVFEDCRVPAENLIGGEGAATICMMRNLEIERVTLAAMSIGIARRSIEVMNRYASERTSFGKRLREFGQIQRYLSQSYAEYMAGRAYTYYTAASMDLEGKGGRLDSDGVKLFTSTMGKEIADRAIQVLGGYGYVSEYQVERLWRDAKLLEIGGGTIEAHQKNMCRELMRTERLL